MVSDGDLRPYTAVELEDFGWGEEGEEEYDDGEVRRFGLDHQSSTRYFGHYNHVILSVQRRVVICVVIFIFEKKGLCVLFYIFLEKNDTTKP